MKELVADNENTNIIDLLRKINQFDLFPDNDLQALIKIAKFREYEAGEVVIKEEDFDSWVYFLLNGKLSLTKKGKTIGVLQRTGDMFGEMGIIDGSSRSATITANDKTLLLCLDATHIDNMLKENELSFCYLIYRIFAEVMAARLRETTLENIKLREALAKLNPI